MKNKLDFIVVGAQKSGTTTLFQLLKQHNDIFLPPEKEAFFFGMPEREKNGWDWYIKEFFSEAADDKLLGTITPHYMAYNGIPQKIHAIIPDVKIIAILRDPFSRTYSQFLMSQRRKADDRSYNEAITELSSATELAKSREDISETASYIIRGEYGRILAAFKREFGSDNILILFTDDLEKAPQGVIDTICDFLGIPKFTPVGVSEKFHKGSGKPRSVLLTNTINWIKKHGGLKKAIKNIMPFKYRRRLVFKIDQWNIDKKGTGNTESNGDELTKANEILKPIFLADAKTFEKEFGITFPWIEKLQ